MIVIETHPVMISARKNSDVIVNMVSNLAFLLQDAISLTSYQLIKDYDADHFQKRAGELIISAKEMLIFVLALYSKLSS